MMYVHAHATFLASLRPDVTAAAVVAFRAATLHVTVGDDGDDGFFGFMREPNATATSARRTIRCPSSMYRCCRATCAAVACRRRRSAFTAFKASTISRSEYPCRKSRLVR